ncbi:hypothetical protein SARC_12296, partial [Sphaeroforma arctica JP610]
MQRSASFTNANVECAEIELEVSTLTKLPAESDMGRFGSNNSQNHVGKRKRKEYMRLNANDGEQIRASLSFAADVAEAGDPFPRLKFYSLFKDAALRCASNRVYRSITGFFVY